MIILPTSTNITTRSDSVNVDATTDNSSGIDSLFSVEDSSQDFLTLLGNRLLSLTQQTAVSVKNDAADPHQAVESDEKSSLSPGIKDLLAALDTPKEQNALLQPAKNKETVKTVVETAHLSVEAAHLSNSDLQALQALYAMLPTTAPVAPKTIGSGLLNQTTLQRGELTKGQIILPRGELAKDQTNSVLLKDHVDSTTVVLTPARSDHSYSDSEFQQAMNVVSKDNGKEKGKENVSSTTNTTITHHALSATSNLLTPTVTPVATTPVTPQLNSQLGSPEWQQALGQQILMFSRNGQQTAELHLHPQDLGSIQISLKLDNDQAQLNMLSNHSQVRAALEAALPQLRHALAESGINLGQSNVSSDAFQQSPAFSGQQEQQRNNNGSPFRLATENDSDVTPIVVPATLQARAVGSSAVDTFA